MNFFKRIGRKTAKIHTKINRIFVPVASAAAGYFGGAPAAAAVTAAGAQASYYFRATEARNKGIRGRAARDFGRKERKRVAIYGAIGGGAGMVGSFGTSLIAGKGLGNSLVALGLGQGGAELVGAGSIFEKSAAGAQYFPSKFVTAGNLAQQQGSSVPGLVTQAQLGPSLAGGGTATEAAAASSGTGTLGKILGVGTTALQAYSTARPASSGANGSINPNAFGPDPSSMFGGGGGGGEAGGGYGGGFMNSPMPENGQTSPGAALAIGALALLLLT